MTHRHLLSLLVIGSISIGMEAFAADSANDKGKVIEVPLPAEAATIPASKLPELKENAMQGSGKAAVIVSKFYGRQGDLKTQIFWLMIAVENGDDEQQLFLARAFARDTDPSSAERARYWYRRIIEHGSSDLSALSKRELAAWESYRKKFPLPVPSN